MRPIVKNIISNKNNISNDSICILRTTVRSILIQKSLQLGFTIEDVSDIIDFSPAKIERYYKDSCRY